MTELLRAEGIGKSYVSGVPVLSGVDLSFLSGEVHALVGENGAGKSTFSNILSGIVAPSTGRMTLLGKPYAPKSRRVAEHLGVTIVTQEFNLLPTMTVAESLTFDDMPSLLGVIDRKRQNALAEASLARIGAQLDVALPISSLGIAQRQLVEVAKGMGDQSRLVILDEPTAALSDTEASSLFARIQALKSNGVCILYISHKLEEVLRLADRVSVLRDGSLVGTYSLGEIDKEGLVRAMVGRMVRSTQSSPPLRPLGPAAGKWSEAESGEGQGEGDLQPQIKVTTEAPGSPVTDQTDLTGAGGRRSPSPYPSLKGGATGPEMGLEVSNVRGVSFTAHKGEIVGLAGLIGAGRTELLRAIFGADPSTGQVSIGNVTLKRRNPVRTVRAGIGLLTEDRKDQGLFLPLSLRMNASITQLRNLKRLGVVKTKSETALVESLREKLAIRSRNIEQPVRELSGGNQQKVVLAKWLAKNCDVLLFDEPTRGIDIGAKEEIYTLVRELAQQGKTILIASSELNELLALCDRILVLSKGELVGEFERKDFNADHIMLAAFSRTEKPA